MKILITGGAGFIGSNLADSLINDNEIIVVDNFNNYYAPELKEKNISSNLKKPNYKLYRTDIQDKNGLRQVFEENKIDCVVHIAASAGVRASVLNPENFVENNISGTLNILEAMREFEVKKLVFASSSSVYGNCEAEKFSENLKATEPISPYAATKSACEQFIYTYTFLYGISAVNLRFFTVYGQRQRPDLAINKFIRLIKNGETIEIYGDGTTIRDYTHIEDIVEGIKSAIKYDKSPYEIINLGSGNPISLSEMIKTIEEVLGQKAIIVSTPPQQGDVNRTYADISKAKALLNYEPKMDFKRGIQKYVEWLSKNEV